MHIVILGAGYAGLRLALDLDDRLRDQGLVASVTLVDKYPYHQIVQELHLTATAGIYARDSIVDLAHILRERRYVAFQQGTVDRIAPLERHIVLADETVLPYDYMVVTLGGVTDYAGVQGAEERSFPLRTYEQALALREHIVASFRAAASTTDPIERRVLLTTAIVGGGYTGCQFAGEMAAWADDLATEVGISRNEARIALIERDRLLLRQFGQWATDEAERVLDRRGVSVYLSTSVERVEPRALYVSGNRVLRAATLVWAAGVRAPSLLADSGLPTDKAGKVFVDRYLRVRDQARIFAAGDCASVPDPDSSQPLPATASYAMRQGGHLADTLVDEIAGRPPRMYEPLKLGEVVSLGPSQAVGNPLGVRVTGQAAALLKKGVEQWYRSTLE